MTCYLFPLRGIANFSKSVFFSANDQGHFWGNFYVPKNKIITSSRYLVLENSKWRAFIPDMEHYHFLPGIFLPYELHVVVMVVMSKRLFSTISASVWSAWERLFRAARPRHARPTWHQKVLSTKERAPTPNSASGGR